MPYEGEFAQFRSIRRLTENERVKNLLGSFHVQQSPSGTTPITDVLRPDIRPSNWQPSLVLALDGSHVEVPVQNGFPGAEASYITVASVLLKIEKTRQLDKDRPVDPKAFRDLEEANTIDAALPGCNVVSEGSHSAEESLRHKVFEIFQSAAIGEGETLLETYEALLSHRTQSRVRDPECPYEDCQEPTRKYTRNLGCYECPCALHRNLYSTDALRFHEGMNPAGTNGAMFAEVMQVLERVWLVHLLREMERLDYLHLLRQTAIVLDGPLALFGHPAWLSLPVATELQRINNVVRTKTGGHDMLLIGVEKTGAFVDHFTQADTDAASGYSGKIIPPQTVGLPTDAYIKRNILFSETLDFYGSQSYFGRKFFYKTASGARIVATLPFLDDTHRNLHTADVEQFPRLTDAMTLLDQVVSSRYPNSISPLISAHAEAAIPLNLGKKVLETMAKELIGRG